MKSNFSFGPGALLTKVGSPFLISKEEWKKVNKYVQEINSYPEKNEFEKRFFNNIFTAANTWQNTTFPKIILFAKQVKSYGQTFSKEKYQILKESLSNNDRTSIDKVSKEIASVLNNNLTLNEEVVTEVNQFIDVAKQASESAMPWGALTIGTQLGPGMSGLSQEQINFLDLMTDIAFPPINVFEKCKGVWQAIESDLTYIQNLINDEKTIDDAFIAGLNLEEAIDDWEKVGIDAENFIEFSNNL
ncbi:MAG: hypothetical protein KAX49_03045 [Halanaerobiales bacterium]|nr:hypothetical protein [Halanaerobiales bacterium]